MHGAGGGRARANADRRAELERTRQVVQKLGLAVQVDPGEALLNLLWEAYGNVEYYRRLVQELPTHPDPDEFVAGDGDGGGFWKRGQTGVYGRTYHVSGVPTGEAKPHVLVSLYDQERDRAASLAATALKAGVEERRIRMVEQDAARIFQAQLAALRALGLEGRVDEFRHAFAAALRPHVATVASVGGALPAS